MKLLRLISCVLVAFAAMPSFAGKIVVTSCNLLPTDMSGQLSKVKDLMGRPCALIKVQVPYRGADFDGVIQTENRHGEYYVWVEDGNKYIKMYFDGCTPETINLSSYLNSGVKAPQTYELRVDLDALDYNATGMQIPKDNLPAPVICFDPESMSLSPSDRFNIYSISEWLKAHPEEKLDIISSVSSMTGNYETNVIKAERIASTVYGILTDTYGIKPERLAIKPMVEEDASAGIDNIVYFRLQ